MSYQGNAVELIRIETDCFTLNIKGKPVHPEIEQLYPDKENKQAAAKLEIDPVGCNIEKFYHYDPEEGTKNYFTTESDSIYPFFYEQQDYQILIEGKGNKKIDFHHENKLVREAVSPLSGKGNVLWGTINFRNDVGYSELEIKGDGRPLFILKIEVFPSKIDYRSDYYQLLQEVNQEVYNLAYDFLRKTYQDMKPAEAENITHIEFFSILNSIFDDFKKAFLRIKQAPHHRLHRKQNVLPASRVKKINRKSIKWLRKNSNYYNREIGLPIKMLNIDKQISFDTFENKFVKWIMKQLIKKLTNFKRRYKNMFRFEKDVDKRVTARIDSLIKEIDSILSRSFLSDVGDIHKIDSLSLVLQMAAGYREIYKYYLMLMKGLSLNGEVFRLSMKEIWKLYEYWCYLKLNRILRGEYQLLKSSLIDFDYSGIYVTLNKSSNSWVEYENPANGERFTLSYNTSEGAGITTGQKPDNVLSLRKEEANTVYKFVFDAKYRIDPAYPGSTYKRKYGSPGPKEDTINTMHRYRDAVVQQDKNDSQYERTMVGAYVLFPYHNEEEFQEHDFYKSIRKVNVGAFPFLPGSAELVSQFLQNLIEESAVGNFERNIMPSGFKEYHKKTNFKQNVIVGSLRNKSQLDLLLKDKFYHIPSRRIKKKVMDLQYIAVYQRKNLFGSDNTGVKYYGKITEIEVRARKEISVPYTDERKDNRPYYIFHVEDWKELDNYIIPDGYGVRGSHIYTNYMLLQRARTIPELSIKTMEQWRLWLELNRLKEKLEVEINDNKIHEETEIDGFKVNNIEVNIIDDRVIINRGDKTVEKGYKDFIYNLRGVMNDLFNK